MEKRNIDILQWAFMANTVAFILHEMDAVFWKEWELFGIPNEYVGLIVFILAHIPLYLAAFYGMLNLGRKSGLIISLAMGFFGMVHLVLHVTIGEEYFVTVFSTAIIYAVFAISSVQLFFTVRNLKKLRETAG